MLQDSRRGGLIHKMWSLHVSIIGALILLVLLVKPGSTFKLYDIFNHKRSSDYNLRSADSDTDSFDLTSTLQCLDDRCPGLELHEMIEDPSTIEDCIAHCLPPSVLAHSLNVRGADTTSGRSVWGLRSREVDPLASCIEAKCIGRPYPVCVYQECMAQLRLGKFRRDNDISDDREEANVIKADQWVEKRGRLLGRRQLEKRVAEACSTCFPKSDHFPGCRMICA